MDPGGGATGVSDVDGDGSKVDGDLPVAVLVAMVSFWGRNTLDCCTLTDCVLEGVDIGLLQVCSRLREQS